MVKHILALTICSALAGCAFGGKNNLPGLGNSDRKTEQDRQNQEDRALLLETYEPVTGLYEKANRDSAGLNLVLGVFISEDSTLKDSSGKSRSLPHLRIKYRLLEGQINPDVTLAAAVQAETGALIASGGPDEITIKAIVIGDKLIGEVSKANGLIGPFELVRKEKVVRAQSTEQEIEFFHLLKQRYSHFLGTYKGTVKSNGIFTSDFPVELELNLPEIVTDDKAELRLKANYRRPDLVGKGAERFMSVAVRLGRLSSQTEISMSSEGTVSGEVPESRFLSISGTLNEDTGEIEAKIMDFQGQLGILKLKRSL